MAIAGDGRDVTRRDFRGASPRCASDETPRPRRRGGSTRCGVEGKGTRRSSCHRRAVSSSRAEASSSLLLPISRNSARTYSLMLILLSTTASTLCRAASAPALGCFVGQRGGITHRRRPQTCTSHGRYRPFSSSDRAFRSTKEPPPTEKETKDSGGGGKENPESNSGAEDGSRSGSAGDFPDLFDIKEGLAEIAPGAFAAAAADAANDAWMSAASVGSFLMQQKHAEEEERASQASGSGEAGADLSEEGSGKSAAARDVGSSKEPQRGAASRASRDGDGDTGWRRRRVEIIDETEVTGLGKALAGDNDGARPQDGAAAVASAPEEKTRTILEEITARLEETTAGVGGAVARMDDDQARDLDEAVTPLKGSLDSLMKDINVLSPAETVVAPIPAATEAESSVSEETGGTVTAMEGISAGADADATLGKRQGILRRFLGMPRRSRAERRSEAAAVTAAQISEEKKTIERNKSASLPLSHPDHYADRIGRDMRHLALSIASSVDTPEQWRTFASEGGGLLPLLTCIRNGARRVADGGPDAYTERNGSGGIVDLEEQYEEEFDAACASCRSLRDLCALSPEFSAVVTDGMLRADAAWSATASSPAPSNGGKARSGGEKEECRSSGGLISDLVTLLTHANEAEKLHAQVQPQRGRRASRLPSRRSRREGRRRCGLYVLQLLLAMSVASDAAVNALRSTSGLTEAVLACSSNAPKERRRRWLRYPIEVVKKRVLRTKKQPDASANGNPSPFIAAAAVSDGLTGQVQRTANMVLAAVGYNAWVPKIPGQKGLRILCLDGGGTRGVTAITQLLGIVDAMGGIEVCDSFDIIAGTSTGAIIAFLVGLRRESSQQAKKRYDELITRIFVKSALSAPMLVFTTAAYDEVHFNEVMQEILKETSMLDSRADPTVPLVFALSSKMSSNPIQVALFRNYNYAGGNLADPFVIDPEEARDALGLDAEDDIMAEISDWGGGLKPQMCPPRISDGSRHAGSFRVLQRAAMRATTAAPTFFKPVKMGGELYSDGGIIASNPTAVAIHEARTLFPDVPIEMVVSCGTGAFIEEKTSSRIGWDGIIGQIVSSATDGEQIHHILEDVLGQGGTDKHGLSSASGTKYFRLNPTVGSPNDFAIDETAPEKLAELSRKTNEYLQEEEQQRKLKEIGEVLEGKKGWAKFLNW